MSDTPAISCEEFQEHMAEWMGSGAIKEHPHLRTCPRCQALLADLESIAEAARQLLAPVEPPEELWAQIESALAREETASELQDES